jgi:hypothetical protein
MQAVYLSQQIIKIAIGQPVELILVDNRWLLVAQKLKYCLMGLFK